MDKKIRVLVAKVGLDGHDRGVKVLAKLLERAGMEVIYLGLHNTPDGVARAAVQEDVDVVGISSLSGEHLTFLPEVRKSMDKYGLSDVVFVAGGVIPWEDMEPLHQLGVEGIFPAGSMVEDIVQFIEEAVRKRRSHRREIDIDGGD